MHNITCFFLSTGMRWRTQKFSSKENFDKGWTEQGTFIQARHSKSVRPQDLKDLAKVIARPLCYIQKANWKSLLKIASKYQYCLQEGQDLEDYNLSTTPYSLRWGGGVPCREISSWPTKDKSPTASNQHGFMKRKSCTANLLAFYNEVTSWVDKERKVDVVCTDFNKAFNSLSHNNLIDTMMKNTREGWKLAEFQSSNCCHQQHKFLLEDSLLQVSHKGVHHSQQLNVVINDQEDWIEHILSSLEVI